MRSLPADFVLGVGYAGPVSRLERGVIELLHAVDPGTGRACCGVSLSIVWRAEDAGGAEVDCPGCRRAIAQDGVS